MYIENVPNHNSKPTILLRESYREGKKVKKRTVANLTNWSGAVIEGMKKLLRGEKIITTENITDSFKIIRSQAHGHVKAVLGSIKNIGLDKILSSKRCRESDLITALIISRIINPVSKLATAREIHQETLNSSIGDELNIKEVKEGDFYNALDWLEERQELIQQKLIKKHFTSSLVLLYDVSSSYFEGTKCPLAKYGYSRDHRKDRLQIVYGLVCNEDGCPVLIEVFEGNTADPKTFSEQVKKLKNTYGIKKIVWIGDRGMITNARVEEDLKKNSDLDWITALRAHEIQALFEANELKIADFNSQDFIEISSEKFPNERLIACKNLALAKERQASRESLLLETQRELDKIISATKRKTKKLTKRENIALKVGSVIAKYKMRKHFILNISDSDFSYQLNQDSIDKEKITDGVYVVRTSLELNELSAESLVLSYKSLSQVERAFRSLKTVDLRIRPIYHRLSKRVKAHVFLCMLAYYVEWHMRQKLAPILFDDDDKDSAILKRSSVVAKAQRSDNAILKAKSKINSLGFPTHSFQTLISDLGSIVKNFIQPNITDAPDFVKVTQPTEYQSKVFNLLNVNL